MDECTICMEDMENEYKTKCCNQLIHQRCLADCIKKFKSCPFCRKENNNTILYMQGMCHFRIMQLSAAESLFKKIMDGLS